MCYSGPSTTGQEHTIREHARIDEEVVLPPLQFPTIATQSPLSTPRDSRRDRPLTADSPTGLRPEPILETLLRTTSFSLNGGCRLCDYQLAKAVSPFYHLKTNVIPCWVVTVLDVTSSGMTASHNRLGTGSALYLYDNALGRMSEGFEQTILLEIGRASCRERVW